MRVRPMQSSSPKLPCQRESRINLGGVEERDAAFHRGSQKRAHLLFVFHGTQQSGTLFFDMRSWKNSSGAKHIITIFLPKGLAHHPLLARCANKIHESERRESVPARQPVFQKEPLR